MHRSERLGAAWGAMGIGGNILGVIALGPVPSAYRPGALDAWTAQTLAHPRATVASAVAFALGLTALAGWAAALGRFVGGPVARAGAAAMAAAATVNAAASLLPLVLVLHVAPGCHEAACAPVARALLGSALCADAFFNLLFGLGLAAVGGALAGSLGRRWLGALGMVAGLATVPVSLQIVSDTAARWLAVAAPLWLLFVAWSSALLWRRPGLRGPKAPHESETPLARPG